MCLFSRVRRWTVQSFQSRQTQSRSKSLVGHIKFIFSKDIVSQSVHFEFMIIVVKAILTLIIFICSNTKERCILEICLNIAGIYFHPQPCKNQCKFCDTSKLVLIVTTFTTPNPQNEDGDENADVLLRHVVV